MATCPERSNRRVRQSFRLAAALFLPLMLGLCGCKRSTPTGNPKLVELYGSADAVKAVAQPDSIDIILLQPLQEGTDWRQQSLSAFSPREDVVTLTGRPAAELGRVLTSPESFDWDFSKGCTIHMDVWLGFRRGGVRVDVLIDTDCRKLAVFDSSGMVSGQRDFDAARTAVVRILKSVFPNDAHIAGLPD